ncbi:MAG: tRNA uridine-5-carboxymethylaminomethyl(34) synthesis GTPase MnmE [Bacteroidetes bacterium]|nr:tRNA uridine-5-carboxymethylaminomethyl(34) synthesis GTPase MnmE [Bacteroidota bacterium]
MKQGDTIVAPATAQGVGAIGVIRLSGPEAIAITQRAWRGKDLALQPSHTIHYGHIIDGDRELDEVMVSIFRGPKSFTTEDVVEISCHGSPYIMEQVLRLLISKGARMADAGEFTLRAFINGRIDLSQAEAVADLIASDSAAAHELAIKQIRGGFAHQIKELRAQLVNFASLIELELDFSEEDVEFVKRDELVRIIYRIQAVLRPLIESFKYGNVIKNGVPVAIVGKPNAGKSTLLNALLNEERAIVSHIAGTTRDTIEEVLHIDGIAYRLIDTAGLRQTEDVIEQIGVERSYDKIKTASILLYMTDASLISDAQDLNTELKAAADFDVPYLLIANKSDLCANTIKELLSKLEDVVLMSAKTNTGIDTLRKKLSAMVQSQKVTPPDMTIANIRHYEALRHAHDTLDAVLEAIDHQITTDLVALELKRALAYLGEISGEVTNDEILGNIFSKFCIGK